MSSSSFGEVWAKKKKRLCLTGVKHPFFETLVNTLGLGKLQLSFFLPWALLVKHATQWWGTSISCLKQDCGWIHLSSKIHPGHWKGPFWHSPFWKMWPAPDHNCRSQEGLNSARKMWKCWVSSILLLHKVSTACSQYTPIHTIHTTRNTSSFWWEKKCMWEGMLAEKKIYYLQAWNHLLCFLHFLFQMVLLFQKLLLPWILQIWPRVPGLPLRLEMRFCLFWKREQLNVVMADRGVQKRLASHNCQLSTLSLTNQHVF